MQGSFSAPPPVNSATGTEWQGILDPGPDEESTAEQRRRENDAEVMRIRQVRQAQAAGHPIPHPRPVRIPKPQAPSIRFQLKGFWFYVIKELPDLPLRPGEWGHYLVTYETFQSHHRIDYARPYKNEGRLPVVHRVPNRAPGQVSGDPKPIPSEDYCIEGRDYVCAKKQEGPDQPPAYYEIGMNTLLRALEEAETRDLAFARLMEGLGNVNPSVVWDCLDPDYDASDRKAVMDQFMEKYLDRFYARVEPGNVPTVGEVSEEVLHKHKTFCKAWTKKHYKTLTPAVTAPAETLTSEFYTHLEAYFQKDRHLSRAELARVLMRHEEFATDFASCLHYFMTSLEQSRGSRNASYKQMTQISAARAWSYNRMGNALSNKIQTLIQLFIRMRDLQQFWLSHLTIDWHAILGQIPQVHRYFDDEAAQSGPAPRLQNGSIVPPWRFAR